MPTLGHLLGLPRHVLMFLELYKEAMRVRHQIRCRYYKALLNSGANKPSENTQEW